MIETFNIYQLFKLKSCFKTLPDRPDISLHVVQFGGALFISIVFGANGNTVMLMRFVQKTAGEHVVIG